MSELNFTGDDNDMSVHDKERPSLGPTEASQDVGGRPVNVVGMPAFTDPNNPAALSGSVNLPLDKHPVTHSEDFGALPVSEVGEHPVNDGMLGGDNALALAEAGQGLNETAYPEDRKDWQKAHWQSMAASLGLTTSGNKGAIQKRVEEHEKEVEDAKDLSAEDWKGQIEDAEDTDELARLRQLYEGSGSDYSTVVSAFEAREQEFAGSGDDD